jgi:S-adenosylmethionine:tRNA ribosyltransferase-isomerase
LSDSVGLPVARFDYDLPPELIAQHPVEPRDSSRLLVLARDDGSLTDCVFRDLPELLVPGDLLVVNDTRVLPARLVAQRGTGGRVELLLLERRADATWRALARPARRLRPGELVHLLDRRGAVTDDGVEVVDREADEMLVRFADEGAIARHGRTPLPPYISADDNDPERYQTVYAREEGSAAAPTAGLHFTPELLERCRSRGIDVATVTLHVGLDTFQPIRTADALKHRMHSERYCVPSDASRRIAAVKQEGRRVVAVGTTSVRTLEATADEHLAGSPGDLCGVTQLYITPGYRFRIVDAMVTNFHLPRTTLLLLVSAFAGEEHLRAAYQHAIHERYRFYSFGDAMLIV